MTCGIAVSVAGHVAGPRQSLDEPIGERGDQLHRWMFEQPDANVAEIAALTSAGAYVMGRNMLGPGRGTWDETWRGWWVMGGGTTVTYVTDGITSALAQARAAAGDAGVAVAGGAATVNQYLAAGLIGDLWLHLAPVVLGAGERLFEGVTDVTLQPVDARHTDLVTHVRYRVT